jgi:hypothetical protein
MSCRRAGGRGRACSGAWSRRRTSCGGMGRNTGPRGSRRGGGRRHATSSWLRAHSRRCSRSRHGWFRRWLLCRRRFRSLLGRLGFFSSRQAAEMLAHQFGVLQVNRARVRLFFRNAGFRKIVNQDFRLDLQFPRQFINPDLIGICHSPLFNSAGTRARAFLHLQNPAPANNCLQESVTFRRLRPTRRFLLRGLLRWLLPSLHPQRPLRLRRPRDQLPHLVPLRLRPQQLLR